MHWIDLLALVPLATFIHFVLGLRGLFKRDLHLKIFICLSILTGIIVSNVNSSLIQIVFFLSTTGILVAGAIYQFRRH